MPQVKQQSYQNVRVGSEQKKRLATMATSNGITQTEVLNNLIDVAYKYGFNIETEINVTVITKDEYLDRLNRCLKKDGE